MARIPMRRRVKIPRNWFLTKSLGGNVFSKNNKGKGKNNKLNSRGRQTTTTEAPTTTTEEPTTTTVNKRIQQQILRARKVEIVDIIYSATRGARERLVVI